MKHLTRYFSGVSKHKVLTMPKSSLGIVVVIPCYNEPDVTRSIKALANCDCIDWDIEVLIVVNYGENATDTVKNQCNTNYKELLELSKEVNRNGFEVIPLLYENMPSKHAGVGLARKTGMDEAAYRFMSVNKPEGIILCFDADSICTPDYFISVRNHFSDHINTGAASLYYEHPIAGSEFSEQIYEAIAQYELHLRYYNQALKWMHLPYAFHTVGSSMLCTASSYAKVGGMNKRKAGEDFYFLQKLIQNVPFYEINTTKVIPSPRISDRVPFGTGRAMMKMESDGFSMLQTYNIKGFKAIKYFISLLEVFYHGDKPNIENEIERVLLNYLEENGLYKKLKEIKNNSTSYLSFRKRFFLWFDAFFVLKFLNYAHETHWKKEEVLSASNHLLILLGEKPEDTIKNTLLKYRRIEKV